MKVATYYRVSTDSQDNNRQIADVESYCKKSDFEIIAKFEEKISGTKKNRKEIIALFDFLELNPDVKYLIVSELSRLGRTNEVLSLIDRLHNIGIGLISLKENITTLDAKGKINATTQMLIGILSSINSYELDTMKYRQKSGIRSRYMAGKGNRKGNNAFGYTADSNDFIIIDEKEATLLREAIDMVLNQNKSLNFVVQHFNYKKLYRRNGYKWTLTALRNNLTNPIIMGNRTLKDGTVIPVPPIINADTFDKIQEIFKLRRYKKNAVSNQNKSSSLSGLIFCNSCGTPYFKSSLDYKCGASTKNSYYYEKLELSSKCNSPIIKVKALEEIVDFLILNIFSDSIISKIDTKDLNYKLIELEGKKESYTKNLKDLNKQNERLLDLFLDEILEKKEFENKKNDLNAKIEAINLALNKINKEILDFSKNISNLNSLEKFQQKVKNDGYISDELRRKIISKITIERGEWENAKRVSNIIVHFSDYRSYPVIYDHFRKIGHVPLLPNKPIYINNAKIAFKEL